MFSRIRPLLILVLAATLSASQAAEEITDPTAEPMEVWHYGSGSNSQTVTFSYNEPPALSSVTISIEVEDNPGEELFSKNYVAPFSNPHTINITVPDPLNDLGTLCVVKVKMYPMSMDPVRTISQNVDIEKP